MTNTFEPWHASTLVELLKCRAELQGSQTAYTFLCDGEDEAGHLTYADLDRRARAIAARLQQLANPGDRALLIYPQGLDFVCAFFGCLYGGFVAVPTPLPEGARLDRMLRRVQVIVDDAQASIVLSNEQHLPVLARIEAHSNDLQLVQRLATDIIDTAEGGACGPQVLDPGALAYLQYTSGSTSHPKGVMVTHANVMANLLGIRVSTGYGADCCTVTWLPYFHDYGLVMGLLQPLYSGFPCYIMSPAAFIQRPVRWLRAISRYRGTHAQGPSFAYALCAAKVRSEQCVGLDLSSWRAAGNGSEPVRAKTVEDFSRAFAPYGFRPEAFGPEYGLAEATADATCKLVGTKVVCLSVDAAVLNQQQRAVAPRHPEAAKTLVSCGPPLHNVTLRIVDPNSHQPRPEGHVGEVWVAGPSITLGYWDKPSESEQVYKAYIADTEEGPFLRTGDLGFLHGGELFVTGRIKDLIIIDGVNHYPHDIEATVEGCHPSIRPGCCVAFSADVDGAERLVIAVESSQALDQAESIVATVRQEVALRHDIESYVVLLLKPGTMRKTTSGKLQRRATSSDFLAGSSELGDVLVRWQRGSGLLFFEPKVGQEPVWRTN